MIVLIFIIIWLLVTKILPQNRTKQRMIEELNFNYISHIDFYDKSNYSIF